VNAGLKPACHSKILNAEIIPLLLKQNALFGFSLKEILRLL
jgi:hypothetical protein